MRRASKMKRMGAARVALCGLGLATILSVALGCGDVSSPTSKHAEGLLADLPTAPEAVQERDLPGCSAQLTPAIPRSEIRLATYPGARDLIVVFRDRLSVCVDTPEVVLRRLGIDIGADQPLPSPGDEQSEGDDDPVPINGTAVSKKANGDDDPVPINGSNGSVGKQANGDDDPVPINGSKLGESGSKRAEGDDDPVPINGRTVRAADSQDDDDTSVPINPAIHKLQLI